jgi:nucleotide-binding universal stress UspA family protein
MAGTILCGVTDSPEARGAAELADALSERLGLRLVLAHVVDGIRVVGVEESLTAVQGRQGGERLLRAVARDLGAGRELELRLAHGERAERLAQLAGEEGADLIVIGSRPIGLRGRRLRPGDVAFVAVGKEHHFVDYELISVMVLFARGG